jgi:hypothetical protein
MPVINESAADLLKKESPGTGEYDLSVGYY